MKKKPTYRDLVIYKPKACGAEQDWRKRAEQWDANLAALKECDRLARVAERLVGRMIQHPYADSYAYYQVIKETKRTATIRVCRGLGDDWVLPAWGEQITLRRENVERCLW
jgi:hypothetical protein